MKYITLFENFGAPTEPSTDLYYDEKMDAKSMVREVAESEFHLSPETLAAIKRNYEVVKQIGHGTFGIAWLNSGNNVVKLTKDAAEAMAAKKIHTRPNTHFADVYSVEKKSVWRGDDYFVITLEFLYPLTQQEEDCCELSYYLSDYFGENAMYYQRFGKDRKEVLNYLRNTPDWDMNIYRWLNEIMDDDLILKIFDEYTPIKMAANKYKLSDLHSKNMGRKKNGTLACYDLRM